MGAGAERERMLSGIDPEHAAEHHAQLVELLRQEMDDRPADHDSEYFENLYWCAFLLHLVGDPADAALMWEAKQIDFDTAIGFDVQFLLGAGPEATLAHLTEHGHGDIAERLREYPELYEDLGDWRDGRRQYFYPST